MAGPTKKELEQSVLDLEKKLQDVTTKKHWRCYCESPIPTYIADENGKVLAYNDAMEELTGYPCQEVPDFVTAIEKIIPDPDYRRKILEMVLKTRESKEIINRNIYVITRKDGRERHVEFSAFYLSGGNIRIVQAVDITERIHAEDALMKSNKRHSSFMENFQGVAFQVDLKKKVPVYLYGLLEEMTGYSTEDFLAGDVYWESLIYKNDFSMVLIELDRMHEVVGLRTNLEFRFVRKDNNIRWIRLIANIIHDENKKPHYLYGSAFDITEFKDATEQTKLQQQQLIQADKMASIGILVSGVAHEINNPNHYILTNADMLKNIWVDIEPIIEKYYQEFGDFTIGNMPYSEMSEHIPMLISAITEGSERIKSIVKELRDYSRLTSVEMNDRVNVNAVVKSAVVLLSNMVEKSTNNFISRLNDSVPAIQGNYRRLEQVLINLVQNACQALEDPGDLIEVSTSYDEEANQVVIRVRDEGIGIPESKLQHITDPFFTTKRESKGTGLGLSITLKIIRDHGGTLTFDSTDGEGTTAMIRLPAGTKKQK